MKVHSELGFGYPEIIYQNALEIEFNIENLSFEKEKTIPVYYKNILVGKRRADFIVDESIIVELKAVSALDDSNINQTLNYLTAFRFEIGLLINFGGKSLEFKRLHNNKLLKMKEN